MTMSTEAGSMPSSRRLAGVGRTLISPRQSRAAMSEPVASRVGVGNMGGRMSRRMSEAGYDVRAVDAGPARIPASGARAAGSLAALAADCDVIMLSLPDSSVIEAVVRGPEGLLAHARAGQV